MNSASLATIRRALRTILPALALVASLHATAGRPCQEEPPGEPDIARGMALAEHVQQSLDASGAQVVLLARAGQDLQKYGLRYSHLGIAYREALPPASPASTPAASAPGPTPAGPATLQPAPPAPGDVPRTAWRIAHKLNECGTAHASVYRQGLGEFFLDSPFRYDAAYVILTPETQAALLPLLRDNARLVQMHTPAYSVVAYPWATTYQQSNQWALETLASALEPHAHTRTQAQAWLQLRDYQPTVLHLGPLTRLGGRITKANVAFDDHPNSKRFSDHIETVTVDSMFDWARRADLGGDPITVR